MEIRQLEYFISASALGNLTKVGRTSLCFATKYNSCYKKARV